MSKKLFYLLLILLPVNLAKHFVFPWCYVNGILVDYLIPTIYVTDVVVWALLFAWLVEESSKFKVRSSKLQLKVQSFFQRFLPKYPNTQIPKYFLLLFLVSLIPSVILAKNQPAAVYRFLKIAEYVLFTLFVAKNIDLRNDFEKIIKALSVGVAFESLLVIGQWLKQSSLFGYLFFGEPIFNSSMFGIAKTEVLGLTKIRPYGTFPHPNVLGGYLAVLLPWMLMGVIRGIRGIGGRRVTKERRFWWWVLVVGLETVGLFLSFSRAAWVVGGVGVALVLIRRLCRGVTCNAPTRTLVALLALGLIVEILAINQSSLSVSRRLSLSQSAIVMISKNPLFGVGLNNFTIALPKFQQTLPSSTQFLQPVHNVFLLIVAESGIFAGTLLFVFLLSLIHNSYFLIQKLPDNTFPRLLTIALGQILILSIVDHYFWTIQQTSLLLWLVVGMIISCVKLESSNYGKSQA